jgi:zinc transport system substrate-binding protein
MRAPHPAGVLILLGLGLASALAAEPVAVLVSILPQKYLVDRVGDGRVRTSVLVGPGQNPHTYEPTARQMAEVSRARAYFRVGVDFEEAWLGRIVQTNPRLRVIDQREGIRLRPADAGHDHGEDAQGRPDPHIWTSPPLARLMATQVRDELTALDPEGARAYAVGFAGLAADLDALDTEIRQALADHTRRRFMVFHPSWGYFADTYGLEQIAIEQRGKEPGGRTLGALIDEARAEGVRVVFIEPQDNPAPAKAVARAVGAQAVTVDALAQDYIANLRRVAAAFSAALR